MLGYGSLKTPVPLTSMKMCLVNMCTGYSSPFSFLLISATCRNLTVTLDGGGGGTSYHSRIIQQYYLPRRAGRIMLQNCLLLYSTILKIETYYSSKKTYYSPINLIHEHTYVSKFWATVVNVSSEDTDVCRFVSAVTRKVLISPAVSVALFGCNKSMHQAKAFTLLVPCHTVCVFWIFSFLFPLSPIILNARIKKFQHNPPNPSLAGVEARLRLTDPFL